MRKLTDTDAVDRIWKALGIASYEEAGGKEISEIVAAKMAEIELLRARLLGIVVAYDNYRGRGVLPAPNEYAGVVNAIEGARAALGNPDA